MNPISEAVETESAVPVPLVGDMTRRRFLAVAGGTAGAVAATAWLRPSFLLGGAAEASPATGNTIVQVFLRGGADGLSIVSPLGDSRYQTVRPGIAIPDSAALALDGNFGLHPAAIALKALYDQGRLAVIPAAGSTNPTRSHFEAQDFIEKGTPDSALTVDGWLGRWMSQSGNGTESPFRGLGIGNGLQASLRGGGATSTPDVASLALDDYLSLTYARGTPEMRDALNAMYGPVADPLLRSQSRSALDVVAELGPIIATAKMPADWPARFGKALWPIARLLAGGIPVEAAACDLGGWDLHEQIGAADNPNASMYKLVQSLDAALGAFFTYLGPIGDKVTVVVMSEFGRRIATNGSGGADHGHGQVMFVAGGGVSAGVKGDWPGVENTDQGDVQVVNDYRLVLAEVLGQRMRTANLGAIFPNFDSSSSRWLGVTGSGAGRATAASADLPESDVPKVGNAPTAGVASPVPGTAPVEPEVPKF